MKQDSTSTTVSAGNHRPSTNNNERPTPRQETPAAHELASKAEGMPVDTILPAPPRNVSIVVAVETFADQVALCRARLQESLEDASALELEAAIVVDRLAVLESQVHDLVNGIPCGPYTFP